ncbi:CGI121 protein [Xylariomycetidae sp. FL0641]|nr:CGI121 protein [Xylariomycetidae sp. FL0641]
MAAPSPLLHTPALEHLPPGYRVHAAAFRGVTNAATLHAQLVGRNAAFEYAFVDAGAVVSPRQVLAAVFRAVAADAAGRLRTPNVHAETVCALSASKNIAEAYRRYGITPATTNLIVVKILTPASATTPQEIEAHLREHVHGQPVPFADEVLAGFTDWARVRKYYKLNGIGWLDGMKDEARKRKELEVLVLGSMALRGL